MTSCYSQVTRGRASPRLNRKLGSVPPTLSTTSYALLGLLVFDGATSQEGMTGYELKQRADRPLRFYWVPPAMSQIYTELGRLTRETYVEALDDTSGKRTTRR